MTASPLTIEPSSRSRTDRPHIRSQAAWTCFVFLLLLAFHLERAQADHNPPDFMSYQGFLADQTGTPIGATSPTNHPAVFRIYDAQTGGTLRWAESQVITVDKGYFSVILGQGSQNASEPHGPLSDVFKSTSASERYIAINVTIGSTATDILPRLRLVPSAYAFLSRYANGVLDTNGTAVLTTTSGKVGINKTPAAELDVNGTVAATAFAGNGSALTGLSATQIPNLDASKVVSGTFTSSQIPNLDASKITSGTLADSRLSSNIPRKDAFNNFTGAVGINTSTAAGKLHVDGGVAITGNSSPYPAGTAGLFTEFDQATQIGYFFAYDYGAIQPRTLLLNSPGGNVGIGTTTPTGAKLVVGGSVNTSLGLHGYLIASTDGYNAAPVTLPVSIQAEQAIVADSFQAVSDARTKVVLGKSIAARDLDTLMGIEVTDFRYKDVVAKGNAPRKKVIAQQVETVFPQAVSRRTDAVPDIYQVATIQNGWIALATDLKRGERVKLINQANTSATHEVLEVEAGRFRTTFTNAEPQIFVFGREVSDFRTVDYETISMLNVSATQELARQVQALQASQTRIAQLELELTQLKQLVAQMVATDRGAQPAANIPTSRPTTAAIRETRPILR